MHSHDFPLAGWVLFWANILLPSPGDLYEIRSSRCPSRPRVYANTKNNRLGLSHPFYPLPTPARQPKTLLTRCRAQVGIEIFIVESI